METELYKIVEAALEKAKQEFIDAVKEYEKCLYIHPSINVDKSETAYFIYGYYEVRQDRLLKTWAEIERTEARYSRLHSLHKYVLDLFGVE